MVSLKNLSLSCLTGSIRARAFSPPFYVSKRNVLGKQLVLKRLNLVYKEGNVN